MLPKWKRPKGKFILKVRHKNTFLRKAGSYDEGAGESVACADTTMSIADAYGFPSYRTARLMQKRLREQYGLDTTIMNREVRRSAR